MQANLRLADGLTPPQGRWLVAGVLAAHVAGLWGLLQVAAVRDAVREVAPVFVDLIAAPAAPQPPVAIATQRPPPRATPPQPAPVLTTKAGPAPAQFVMPVQAEPAADPQADPMPAAPGAPSTPALVAPSAPTPAAPPPKMIPASAVDYLVAPAPEYPRLSKKLGEAGLVVVRAYADEQGLPHDVHIERSSGFARLDDAALAAVRKARFKPYTENGRATGGWVRMPFPFELEK